MDIEKPTWQVLHRQTIQFASEFLFPVEISDKPVGLLLAKFWLTSATGIWNSSVFVLPSMVFRESADKEIFLILSGEEGDEFCLEKKVFNDSGWRGWSKEGWKKGWDGARNMEVNGAQQRTILHNAQCYWAGLFAFRLEHFAW